MARTGVCRCLIALLSYLTDNGKGSSAIEHGCLPLPVGGLSNSINLNHTLSL